MVTIVRMHLEFFELGGQRKAQSQSSQAKTQENKVELEKKIEANQQPENREEIQQKLIHSLSQFQSLSKDRISEIQVRIFSGSF